MRADSLLRLPASAEFWNFTVTQDPISGEVVQTYAKDSDIRLMLTEKNDVPIAFTRELLPFNGQLRNIVDASATPILDVLGNTRVAWLGSPVAQFDVFGNIIGYKYTLTVGNA